MKYALIKDNIVENIIVCDEPPVISSDYIVINVDNITSSPGWKFDGQNFIDPTSPAPEEFEELTPRQIRLALVESGISLSVIDDLISSMEEPNKTILKIEWENAISFKRDYPALIKMAYALGLNDSQIDALWRVGESK